MLHPQIHNYRVLDQHLYQEQEYYHRRRDQRLESVCCHLLLQTHMSQLTTGIHTLQHVVVTPHPVCVSLLHCLFPSHYLRA
jgi:hypothetical protein